MIADTLHRLNIPYRYEYPLEITTEKGQRRPEIKALRKERNLSRKKSDYFHGNFYLASLAKAD